MVVMMFYCCKMAGTMETSRQGKQQPAVHMSSLGLLLLLMLVTNHQVHSFNVPSGNKLLPRSETRTVAKMSRMTATETPSVVCTSPDNSMPLVRTETTHRLDRNPSHPTSLARASGTDGPQNRVQDEAEGDELISRRLFLGAVVATGVLSVASESAEARTTEKTGGAATSTVVSAAAVTTATGAVPIDWGGIFQKASKRALGGGKAGAAAAIVQVCSLMWLRTSMNYQYRYGGNLKTSLTSLWNEGGIPRLYQGLPFALVQGPLTRFGDTAANVGILVLLESLDATRDLPLPLKTAAGSLTAGLWRIVLMPIDASKTAMQVEGQSGLERLWQDATGDVGPGALYRGAFAQAAATAAGHYPWFLTYNALNANLPPVSAESDLLLSLARSALLGLAASCVSDCVSNSLRVIKTTKQTAQLGTTDDTTVTVTGDAGQKKELSYPEIVSMIVKEDGVMGLLGRGLQTRLLTNAIQGALFSVLWRYFQEVGFMQ